MTERELWLRLAHARRLTVIDRLERIEGSWPWGLSARIVQKREVVRCRRRLWPLARRALR